MLFEERKAEAEGPIGLPERGGGRGHVSPEKKRRDSERIYLVWQKREGGGVFQRKRIAAWGSG